MRKALLAVAGAFAAITIAACSGGGGGGGGGGTFLLAIGNSNLVSDGNGTAQTTLLVARQGYDGPITVTLGPGAPAGLTMDPLVIAAGATAGTVVLHRGTAPLGGPFPFTLVGTGSGDASDDVQVTLLIAGLSGQLDPTFDGDGMVAVSFPQGPARANAVLELSDGSLVIAGEAGGDFGLARVNTGGTLVATFGSNGRVVTDFHGGNDWAYGLIRQFDGKLVAGGSATNTAGDFVFALARYTQNGVIDPTFGNGGKVTTHPGFEGGAWTLLQQPDGKILAGGTATVGVGSNFAMTIIRYESDDGALDTTFGGGDGIVQHLVGPTHAETFALDITNIEGGYLITAAGYSYVGTEKRWTVLFLTEDGDLIVDTIGPVDGGEARAFRILDDKFVVAGFMGIGNVQGFMAGLDRGNGTLDDAFGPDGDGHYRAPIGLFGRALVVQQTGKLVLAGDEVGDWTALRTDANGLADTTWFAPVIDFGGNDQATDAFIIRDSRIVIVGDANGDMGVARLWP